MRIERRAFALVATVAALALFASCREAPNGPVLPEAYLGQWYYMGSSGGIAGDGIGDEATGYVVIGADNTIDEHAEDGALVGTSRFTPMLGSTIFSTEPLWILDRGAQVPEVIRLSEDGRSMTLSENVYDGFQRTYARVR